MARYQYRISGTFEWFASSGSALAAVTNRLGSNKKVTLRSAQISSLTVADNATAGTPTSTTTVFVRLMTGGVVVGGESVAPAPLDTDAAAWPSTVTVTKNANHLSANTVGTAQIVKNMVPAGLQYWFRQRPSSRWGGLARGVRRGGSTPVEKVVIRQGENYSVRLSIAPQLPLPLRASITMRRQGSPARTWVASCFVIGQVGGECLIAVANEAGSGEVIEIVDVAVEEVGTFDSPYFQLVPVGSMDPTSVTDPVQPSVLKMDTNYPDPLTWLQVFANAPFLPRDVPEQALSDASAGSPKGSNYLKAKDFIGPVYRCLFPEYAAVSTVRLPDGLHHHLAPSLADMGVMRAGITLRPGEGVALVSAAETAAISTAVGLSGWNAYEITFVFDVEPLFEPTINVTGLTNPSEVRIYEAGTTTLLAGQENVTSGTFSWTYDPEVVTDVDIAILSLGYQNIRLLNQALPATSDLTIPVQQQTDRQYENI